MILLKNRIITDLCPTLPHQLLPLLTPNKQTLTTQPLLIPLRHPQQRLRIPIRRLDQPLPIRIFSDTFKHRPDGAGEALKVGGFLGGGGVEALVGEFGW